MKLQQLRYIVEVANHRLNLSATAESLYTSQPGISKQVRMLEDELGVQIFERSGKHLTQITPIGRDVIKVAAEVLDKVATIKVMTKQHVHPEQGTLTIAATHLQARYILPALLKGFMTRFPKVAVTVMQGSAAQCRAAVLAGVANLLLVDDLQEESDLLMLPCFQWQRGLVLPKEHPLAKATSLTPAELVEFALVTDGRAISAAHGTDCAHSESRIACSSSDSDVLKTYVRQGMGIGVMATFAWEPQRDGDLLLKPVPWLPGSVAAIGLRRGAFLCGYLYDLIERLAPQLTREQVNQCCAARSGEELDALLANLTVPQR
ncbi:CysB family transcriptional regulator [Aeromonas sobria]|uniref:LysR substrate-binding domain-containing protein n=1 Tax=Aeromonas sobria TaxID=646 RepID=UPI00111A9008|nr:LysR substrate-binding domain-containing protein [Aeromonas sobria]TNJ23572.1 CysB family transcriptional regulator [Aeromonas sobria]